MRSRNWLKLIPICLGTLAGLALTACETLSPGTPGNLVPLTVAEDPTLPAIDMNGSRFHIETFGNPANPVVIFLHGGPGVDYRGMLRLAGRNGGYSLSDDYFLVFWDQRGTGLSKRHNRAEISQSVYVSDLDSLIERFSPGRPVFLVGHSWGGMYATRYINEFPQKIAGAVLMETGPLTGELFEARKKDIAPLDLGSEVLNDVVWHSQFFSPDDHARMDFEMLVGNRDGQPRYHVSKADFPQAWRFGAAVSAALTDEIMNDKGIFEYDLTTNLGAYTTPVLFLAGALSEVVGPSLQQEQMTKYPAATLTVIPGVGHELQWERAPEVLTHIRAYLTARGGAQ